MTEQTDAAEELARMIDSQIDGTIVSRAEHDPNCPGGGPECARLCPVRVQDYGDTTDLAAAILASDWYRQQIAAAEVRGAQAERARRMDYAAVKGYELGYAEGAQVVLAAVEGGQVRRTQAGGYYVATVGDIIAAARAAAAAAGGGA